MEIKGACPHCGSYNVGAAHVAYANLAVSSWAVDDEGELFPELVDGEAKTNASEWHIDARLFDQDEGYQCLDCHKDFGEPVRVELPSTPEEIAMARADGAL